MTKRMFIHTNFQQKVLDIIAKVNRVVADYGAQGLSLTVRQIYYRFIAFDLFPNARPWIDEEYNKRNGLLAGTKNTIKNYKRLADIINNGRLAGLIDWDAIEDRTRWLREYQYFTDPANGARRLAHSYTEDVWMSQPRYVEVWVEKDALSGVIQQACDEYRVPYFPCRGYVSQSEQYAAGERLRQVALSGKEITVFHLGDHDPSGMDMSRDNEERLLMFGRLAAIDFRRLALNMDQIEQYEPPANPTKETDSRCVGYVESYGEQSWELDALEPKVITDLVRENIEALLDRPAFDAALEAERVNKQKLLKLSANWLEVETLLDMIED